MPWGLSSFALVLWHIQQHDGGHPKTCSYHAFKQGLNELHETAVCCLEIFHIHEHMDSQASLSVQPAPLHGKHKT